MGSEKKSKIVVHGNDRVGFQIWYDGIYDFRELLATINNWFEEMEYDVIPEEHSEKINPDGKEMKILIGGVRKVTEYVRFLVEIEIVVKRELDVLVEYKGKKVRQQQGEMEVRVKTTLQKNWKKTFSLKQELLRQTFEKYIMKKSLDWYEDKLRAEGDMLIGLVKQHLAQYHW